MAALRLRSRGVQQRGPKSGLLEVMVRGKRIPNAPPIHDDERQAIRQTPVFVRASAEQPERFRVQLRAEGDHLNSRAATDPFVPERRFGTGRRIRLPTNRLRGDQKRLGLRQIVLPGERLAVMPSALSRIDPPPLSRIDPGILT